MTQHLAKLDPPQNGSEQNLKFVVLPTKVKGGRSTVLKKTDLQDYYNGT